MILIATILIGVKEQETERGVSYFDYSKMAPEMFINFLIIVFYRHLIMFGKFGEDPPASF